MSAPTIYQRATRSGKPFGYELSLGAAVVPTTPFAIENSPPAQWLVPDAHEPGQQLVDPDEYHALIHSALFDEQLTDDASSGTDSTDTPQSRPTARQHAPGSAPRNNTRKSNARRASSRAQLTDEHGATRKDVHRRHRARGERNSIPTTADAIDLPRSGPAWIGDRNASIPRRPVSINGTTPGFRPRSRPESINNSAPKSRLESVPGFLPSHPHPQRPRPAHFPGAVQSTLPPTQHPLPPRPAWLPSTRPSTSNPATSAYPPPSTSTSAPRPHSIQEAWPYGFGRAGPPLAQAQVDQLVGKPGFSHINWSGDVALPLLDASGRIVGVLGGRPNDASGWRTVADGAYRALRRAEPKLKIPEDQRHHRRAQIPFAALACGVSHGGGQLEPGVLKHSTRHLRLTRALLNDPHFKRIAGVYRTWAPRLYDYYADTRQRLFAWKPSLRAGWPFEDVDGVFAAATFNFGRAVSCSHLDFGNLAWGWCSITALGDFDPTLGGHLILWELGLLITFPPGSSILIPSAAVHHSNTAIQANERRCSFVQYSAGGLFRWVDSGCRSNADFEQNASDEEKRARAARAASRWVEGLEMLEVV